MKAVKHDQKKVRFDLIPAGPLEDVAKVFTFGASKYAEHNYRGLAWNRIFRALIGHAWAWWRGEELDAETGLSHLAHAGCCVLMLMEMQSLRKGKDNRKLFAGTKRSK